jgi:hypothetical protein
MGRPCGGAGNRTRPARDIENRVGGSDPSHPEERFGRVLMGGQLGKVNSLSAELIDDLPIVLVHRIHHAQHLAS